MGKINYFNSSKIHDCIHYNTLLLANNNKKKQVIRILNQQI